MTLPASLADALVAAATRDRGITFIERDGESRTSYAQLLDTAMRILAWLNHAGVGGGAGRTRQLVILLRDNRQFVDVFWACQLGGIVPVPLAPGNTDEHCLKTLRVLRRLDGAVLYTDQHGLHRLIEFASRSGLRAEFEPVRQRAIEVEFIPELSERASPSPAGPDAIATIQFSSGSTGEPKGALLTHANLVTNIAAISDRVAMNDADSTLSWVPLTHDLGMVAFHLLPVVLSLEQSLIPPDAFARRPLLWLEQASARRATVLCSPNFGYRHVLKSIAAKPPAALDLSAVRIVYNGAEPVSHAVCNAFLAELACHGLRPGTMLPVYGMAEASVGVTVPPPGGSIDVIHVDRNRLETGTPVTLLSGGPEGDVARGAATIVGVGTPLASCELRIVDDRGAVVAPGAPGHIEIRGASVSPGYHGEPPRALNEWFDTGDLGLLHAGQLYVTGRAKDTIIVNGLNYHPSDLERLCAPAGGLDPGRLACCGVADEDAATEAVVAFVVHRGPLPEFVPIDRAIRRALGETLLRVRDVVPVRSLPKTTSGKIERYRLAGRYRDGEFTTLLAELAALRTLAGAAPGDDLVHELCDICNGVIMDAKIGPADNLIELGTDSLALAEICAVVDERYPDLVDISDFLDYPTMREFADFLARRRAEGGS